MKKTLFGCLSAAAVALTLQFTSVNAHAGLFSDCSPCDEITDCNLDDSANCDPCDAACGTKAGKWFLNGHMEAGFFVNGHGSKNTRTGSGDIMSGRGTDYYSGNTALLANTRLADGTVNQVYISMGKSVDGRRGLDIGGTVDFTWGSDAYRVQSAGMEYWTGHGTGDAGNWGTGDYYSAFAQAYVEVAYKRWNVIAGKFYAPFGSSSYKSTDNFFYSWAPTSLIAPTVGGGAYASYKVSDNLTVLGGWVMPSEIGESKDNNAVLGGVIWSPSKRLNIRYAFAAGENHYDSWSNIAGGDYDLFVHSLVATAKISKRWKYVFDWTYIHAQHLLGADKDNLDAYGVNNELIYQYNNRWAFGGRFGTLAGDGVGAVGLLPGYGNILNNETLYTVSLGANWTPNKWLTVKPEVRYDWINNTQVFNTWRNSYQVSGGMSALVKF